MESNKKWRSFDFGPPHSNPKTHNVSKSKTENASPEKTTVNQSVTSNKLISDTVSGISKMPAFDFHQKLTPKTVSELAVHPKKIQEVESWLQRYVVSPEQNMKRSQFLVISGPTGSGKTVTLNVICSSLGISVSEWVNPIDQDYEIKGQNQISQFMEFLGDSKWNSLFDDCAKKITLVKDFPNAVIHRPEQFFDILEECSYKTDNPIVFICTDSNSSNINLVRMLFPDDIMAKYSIAHISFNSSASTLMKSAIKRAAELIKERTDLFKQPSPSTVDAIIASSMGDIRNTMNQFYLASLKGTLAMFSAKAILPLCVFILPSIYGLMGPKFNKLPNQKICMTNCKFYSDLGPLQAFEYIL
ncbi:unnamed protein product [Acanthoscelides obtectus]|uniref:Cell cycle checkpoint protein RAD17 n=1 Tax=Acanthoscelides obtectus TaxID=200917 RepID=A0A9P0PWU8_ACAOB|nr:unnamed protein product [Acanthoscelides obtectus]CAK1629470.1 Cell cycle checkpoint protein RAD17 [Acanthoscelides obtectus]